MNQNLQKKKKTLKTKIVCIHFFFHFILKLFLSQLLIHIYLYLKTKEDEKTKQIKLNWQKQNLKLGEQEKRQNQMKIVWIFIFEKKKENKQTNTLLAICFSLLNLFIEFIVFLFFDRKISSTTHTHTKAVGKRRKSRRKKLKNLFPFNFSEQLSYSRWTKLKRILTQWNPIKEYLRRKTYENR